MGKKKWLLKKLLENSKILEKKPYKYFSELIDKDPLHITEGLIGSNDYYQIEVNTYYDDKNESVIRVMLSIDNGGWRSIFPIVDSFTIEPPEEKKYT